MGEYLTVSYNNSSGKMLKPAKPLLHYAAFFIPLLFLASLMLNNLIRSHYAGELYCPRCNVLLISIETLRADHMGCYGYGRDTTPFIDSLAAQGFLFENVFAPRGWTWPSLTSMLTSMYPSSTNVRRGGQLLDPGMPTVSSVLNENGYATSAFLTNFCVAGDYGFSESFCRRLDDERITSDAIGWLEAHKDEKFFLWLHYFAPHKPYQPPGEYDVFTGEDYGGVYNGSNEQNDHVFKNRVNLSLKDLDQVVSLYDGEILYADSQAKKVYEALGEMGLLDDTIVVVTSDHGEDLYQHNHYFYHQCSVYDSSLRIPLIIRLPGGRRGGERAGGIAENIDLAPTLLDLLGVAEPPSFEGESLTPLMSSENAASEFSFALSEWEENISSIRTGEWRYIYNPGNISTLCAPNRTSYPVEFEELYNHATDPNETTNVAEEFPEIAFALRERLLRLYPPRPGLRDALAADNETLRRLEELGYLI